MQHQAAPAYNERPWTIRPTVGWRVIFIPERGAVQVEGLIGCGWFRNHNSWVFRWIWSSETVLELKFEPSNWMFWYLEIRWSKPRRILEIPNGFGYPQVDIIRKRFIRFINPLTTELGAEPTDLPPVCWTLGYFQCWPCSDLTLASMFFDDLEPSPEISSNKNNHNRNHQSIYFILFLIFYINTHTSIQIINLNPT